MIIRKVTLKKMEKIGNYEFAFFRHRVWRTKRFHVNTWTCEQCADSGLLMEWLWWRSLNEANIFCYNFLLYRVSASMVCTVHNISELFRLNSLQPATADCWHCNYHIAGIFKSISAEYQQKITMNAEISVSLEERKKKKRETKYA